MMPGQLMGSTCTCTLYSNTTWQIPVCSVLQPCQCCSYVSALTDQWISLIINPQPVCGKPHSEGSALPARQSVSSSSSSFFFISWRYLTNRAGFNWLLLGSAGVSYIACIFEGKPRKLLAAYSIHKRPTRNN